MSQVTPPEPHTPAAPVWTDALREAAFNHWIASLVPTLGVLPHTVRLASAEIGRAHV